MIVGGVAGVVAAVLVELREMRRRGATIRARTILAIAALAFGGVAAFAGFEQLLTTQATHDSHDALVRFYCSGAVSDAQFQGCVAHVTAADIDRLANRGSDGGLRRGSLHRRRARLSVLLTWVAHDDRRRGHRPFVRRPCIACTLVALSVAGALLAAALATLGGGTARASSAPVPALSAAWRSFHGDCTQTGSSAAACRCWERHLQAAYIEPGYAMDALNLAAGTDPEYVGQNLAGSVVGWTRAGCELHA